MDVMRSQLQGLLTRVRTWEDRIKKTTYADSVLFSVHMPTNEFTITVSWHTRAGTPGSYAKRFTQELVFGPAERRGVTPTINRTVCSFMKEFMQEVLHSRGV